jgi:hypothetical protein
MTDYDCKAQGHHWIDHPEDGQFCFYCDEKYDFVKFYNRIEKLEAALRMVIDWDNTLEFEDSPAWGDVMESARKALEGKDD